MNSENRTITIIVSPQGQTQIETHGFSGPACQLASKFIEEALGRNTAEQLKTSFFQENFNQYTEYETQ